MDVLVCGYGVEAVMGGGIVLVMDMVRHGDEALLWACWIVDMVRHGVLDCVVGVVKDGDE